MSLETWKREFYPSEAWEEADSGAGDTALLRAAILKWTGLKPENLDWHGVLWDGDHVWDAKFPDIRDADDAITIDSASCALCIRYDEVCEYCPIRTCYGYGESCNDVTPEPMLKTLRAVLKRMEGNDGE